MLHIELRAVGGPGHGELWIRGGKQDADGLELSIQRNQDDYYLDPAGHWGGRQHWHRLPDVRTDDGVLRIAVGPWLVDPLTADRYVSYRFHVRGPNGSNKGVLRIIGELLGSAAANKSGIPEAAPETIANTSLFTVACATAPSVAAPAKPLVAPSVETPADISVETAVQAPTEAPQAEPKSIPKNPPQKVLMPQSGDHEKVSKKIRIKRRWGRWLFLFLLCWLSLFLLSFSFSWLLL